MRTRVLGALLLTAVLPLGACGDDDDNEAEPTATTADTGAGTTESAGIRVDLKDFAFAPDRVAVPVGGMVSWRNGDNTTHTITADDGSFDSGNKSSGQSFEHTFSKAGEFTYKCTIHTSMKGTVSVSG